MQECDVNNNSIGLSESDKKIQLQFQLVVLLEICFWHLLWPCNQNAPLR